MGYNYGNTRTYHTIIAGFRRTRGSLSSSNYRELIKLLYGRNPPYTSNTPYKPPYNPYNP